MKYATYLVTPDMGHFDVGEKILREAGATLEAIHNYDLLNDGTVILLYEMRGSREDIESVLNPGDGKTIDYQVSENNGSLMIQLHYHPSDMVADLFELTRRHAALFDYPMEYIDRGSSGVSLRISMVGKEQNLKE
ncbi:MAG: DNA-binding protein, partial [Halobacteria archaeon]|nr:DNA-binding protein [Halobacteria archaeon]